MRARIQLRLRDREGNRSACSIRADRPILLSQLVTRAQAFEAVISGLTTAEITGGSIVLPFTRAPGIGAAGSDVRDALLVVFNQGDDYSSILVPSPRPDLPFDTSGAYVGIRIRESNPGAVAALDPLITFLSGASNRDGSPFVVGPWVAGRTRNR